MHLSRAGRSLKVLQVIPPPAPLPRKDHIPLGAVTALKTVEAAISVIGEAEGVGRWTSNGRDLAFPQAWL